jgi:tetratricopeptide (TPR) repeat protein
MKKFLKIVLLVSLVSLPSIYGRTQNFYHKHSLRDSLEQMLMQIREETKNDVLRSEVIAAITLFKNDPFNDSLLKKLLIVDSLLVNSMPPDQPIALLYTKALVKLFKDVPSREAHIFYASSLSNMSLLLFQTGNYNEALLSYKQVSAFVRNKLGEEHPFFATILNDQANLYRYMRQYKTALPLYKQALAIRKKIFGEGHPEYATILNRLAFLYFGTGNYDEALTLYDQALDIRKKTSGEEHPDYANSLNNRGLLHFVLGQYDKALQLYEQALAIQRKLSGEGHPE